MKLAELDRAYLEIADLKLQLISKAMEKLLSQSRQVSAEGNALIKGTNMKLDNHRII